MERYVVKQLSLLAVEYGLKLSLHTQITLASGNKIPCDLYIPAFSTGGNSSFMPSSAVDKKGYVVVDDTFKVASLNNVFALGDW